MIRRSASYVENGISEEMIISCLKDHEVGVPRFKKLEKYYKGEHDILKRKVQGLNANNSVVGNYAKYITDTVTGYLLGNPISLTSETGENLDDLIELNNKIDIATHNSELEKYVSVYGRSYELAYINAETRLKFAILDPINTFIVYDETVENNSLFGVNYGVCTDETGKARGYNITVYTKSKIITYFSENLNDLEFVSEKEHYFKRVPITEVWNNAEGLGDFEGVISLLTLIMS